MSFTLRNVRASFARNSSTWGQQDPYLDLEFCGKVYKTTMVKGGGREVEWSQPVLLEGSGSYELLVIAKAHKALKKDKVLGSGSVDLMIAARSGKVAAVSLKAALGDLYAGQVFFHVSSGNQAGTAAVGTTVPHTQGRVIEGVGGATHTVEMGRPMEMGRPIDQGPSAAFFAVGSRPNQPQSQAPMTAVPPPSLQQPSQAVAMDTQGPRPMETQGPRPMESQGPAAVPLEAPPPSGAAASGSSHFLPRNIEQSQSAALYANQAPGAPLSTDNTIDGRPSTNVEAQAPPYAGNTTALPPYASNTTVIPPYANNTSANPPYANGQQSVPHEVGAAGYGPHAGGDGAPPPAASGEPRFVPPASAGAEYANANERQGYNEHDVGNSNGMETAAAAPGDDHSSVSSYRTAQRGGFSDFGSELGSDIGRGRGVDFGGRGPMGGRGDSVASGWGGHGSNRGEGFGSHMSMGSGRGGTSMGSGRGDAYGSARSDVFDGGRGEGPGGGSGLSGSSLGRPSMFANRNDQRNDQRTDQRTDQRNDGGGRGSAYGSGRGDSSSSSRGEGAGGGAGGSGGNTFRSSARGEGLGSRRNSGFGNNGMGGSQSTQHPQEDGGGRGMGYDGRMQLGERPRVIHETHNHSVHDHHETETSEVYHYG